MIDLQYSLIIEATKEPDFFGFYSPELEGFTGVGHSIEDCIYKAKWGMIEHIIVYPIMIYILLTDNLIFFIINQLVSAPRGAGSLVAESVTEKGPTQPISYRVLSRLPVTAGVKRRQGCGRP